MRDRAYCGAMETLARVWSSIVSRFRDNRRNEPVSVGAVSPIEPMGFPEDLQPAGEDQSKLDWFSTDLYAFGLDKFRQG